MKSAAPRRASSARSDERFNGHGEPLVDVAPEPVEVGREGEDGPDLKVATDDRGRHAVRLAHRKSKPANEFQGEAELREAVDRDPALQSLSPAHDSPVADPGEDVVELLGADPEDRGRGG